jgi:hypothetical protein
MARENQGLQIALIVSVMLTIVLAVTAFLFYRSYDEACTREKAQAKTADEKDKLAKTALEENNRLKQLLGVPVTEQMQAIDTLFKQDMESYGGTFPEEKRVYREVLKELAKTLQEKDASLASSQADLQKMKDDYKAREASKDPQIKQHEETASRASQDLAAERGKFKADADRIRADHAAVAAQLQKSQKEAADEKSNLETQVQQSERSFADINVKYKDKSRQLEHVLKETVDAPAGQVTQVDQRTHTVYINLGRADGLRRQLNFSVYAIDAIDFTKTGKKAAIEVTEILGDHLAEAQILDNKLGDPIIRGDKIYTPVWSPGEQRHFAVAGLIDLNGNGTNDLPTLRNLIKMNGGVIDCEMDEKGEVHGQMSTHTRYLILGDSSKITEKSSKAVLDALTKLTKEAERLGVREKPLADFLEDLGWKNHTPVVQYGLGANPNDFRAKAPEGGNKVSGGTVSEKFQPRNPSKPSSNSAY